MLHFALQPFAFWCMQSTSSAPNNFAEQGVTAAHSLGGWRGSTGDAEFSDYFKQDPLHSAVSAKCSDAHSSHGTF